MRTCSKEGNAAGALPCRSPALRTRSAARMRSRAHARLDVEESSDAAHPSPLRSRDADTGDGGGMGDEDRAEAIAPDTAWAAQRAAASPCAGDGREVLRGCRARKAAPRRRGGERRHTSRNTAPRCSTPQPPPRRRAQSQGCLGRSHAERTRLQCIWRARRPRKARRSQHRAACRLTQWRPTYADATTSSAGQARRPRHRGVDAVPSSSTHLCSAITVDSSCMCTPRYETAGTQRPSDQFGLLRGTAQRVEIKGSDKEERKRFEHRVSDQPRSLLTCSSDNVLRRPRFLAGRVVDNTKMGALSLRDDSVSGSRQNGRGDTGSW
ncbi:hypothetical protein B0H10DRAFT_2064823 [Mycena sp. CBHHK59/15]|nr:hypothetical protein B0H10DRAFT_2064823 [Mycena sp. CBHHK59/15]